MAKESMKAREVKRARLVAKYAEKRAALKRIIATTDDINEAYSRAFPATPTPSACTTAARSLAVPKATSVSLVFLVSNSARWLPQVLSRA